jgi:hypothetical protein
MRERKMNKSWQEKQKESIQSGYFRAKELAREIWLEGDHEGTPNDFYYFQCGFVAGLNYAKNPDDSAVVDEMNRKMQSTKKRLDALDKLSELDQELGLQ